MPIEMECNSVPILPSRQGPDFAEYTFPNPPEGPGGMVTWYEALGILDGAVGVPLGHIRAELPEPGLMASFHPTAKTDQPLYPSGPNVVLTFDVTVLKTAAGEL